jgi:hypothetical protein
MVVGLARFGTHFADFADQYEKDYEIDWSEFEKRFGG